MPGLDLRGPGVNNGSRNVAKVRSIPRRWHGVAGDDEVVIATPLSTEGRAFAAFQCYSFTPLPVT
jgi:hypothetical protein